MFFSDNGYGFSQDMVMFSFSGETVFHLDMDGFYTGRILKTGLLLRYWIEIEKLTDIGFLNFLRYWISNFLNGLFKGYWIRIPINF